MDASPSPTGIRIPHDRLAPDTLRNVVEELVTRDGTEFTDSQRKADEVLRLLDLGRAELWFDEESRSFNLVATDARDARSSGIGTR